MTSESTSLMFQLPDGTFVAECNKSFVEIAVAIKKAMDLGATYAIGDTRVSNRSMTIELSLSSNPNHCPITKLYHIRLYSFGWTGNKFIPSWDDRYRDLMNEFDADPQNQTLLDHDSIAWRQKRKKLQDTIWPKMLEEAKLP